MLCLRGCLHYRLGFAGEYNSVEDRQKKALIDQGHALFRDSLQCIIMLI